MTRGMAASAGLGSRGLPVKCLRIPKCRARIASGCPAQSEAGTRVTWSLWPPLFLAPSRILLATPERSAEAVIASTPLSTPALSQAPATIVRCLDSQPSLRLPSPLRSFLHGAAAGILPNLRARRSPHTPAINSPRHWSKSQPSLGWTSLNTI